MQRLLESGGLRTKLRVSQPGDADEQEADRAAEQAVSARPAPLIQRKCACGGSCSQCRGEEENEPQGVIHRSPMSGSLAERTPALVVEDEAPSLASGQMRKTEFVALLQTRACATADAVLESVGHTTKSCPYLKKWLEHYKHQDAQHLIRAMHKYAPETMRARSAHEAIGLLNHRVRRAALNWAKTGKVSDLPEGISQEIAEAGGMTGEEKKESAATKKAGGGGVQRKSRGRAAAGGHDAAQVSEQLGSGHSLDGRVQSRMSAAFQYDFSGVRVHTGARGRRVIVAVKRAGVHHRQ